jgi:hypothetical protein
MREPETINFQWVRKGVQKVGFWGFMVKNTVYTRQNAKMAFFGSILQFLDF